MSAYRITDADVKAILNYDPSITDLTPFIAAADELVTELCQNAWQGPNYTEERLEIIETWLAAHFVSIRDPRYVSESMGAASVSTGMTLAQNLGLTSYGQQALLLDTNGGLAWIDKHKSQGKRSRVGITWLGTDMRKLRDSGRVWLYSTLDD